MFLGRVLFDSPDKILCFGSFYVRVRLIPPASILSMVLWENLTNSPSYFVNFLIMSVYNKILLKCNILQLYEMKDKLLDNKNKMEYQTISYKLRIKRSK